MLPSCGIFLRSLAAFYASLFSAYVERNDVFTPPDQSCYPDGERTF